MSLSGIITSVSSAIAGLIGAGIGALAGVAGAFISQRMQARATKERALQSKREEAYSSTLRYLLRVQNRRSGISAEGGITYITKDAIKDFFDDVVDAQFWLSTLTIYCAEDQKETVEKVSRNLNETVAGFVSGESMRHIDKKPQLAGAYPMRMISVVGTKRYSLAPARILENRIRRVEFSENPIKAKFAELLFHALR